MDNCPVDPNPLQEDVDGDTIGDVCDKCPSDAGGVCDPCPANANPGCVACPPGTDADGDGICLIEEVLVEEGSPTSIDNCPDDPNPDQADTDGDGIGNACDSTP